MEKHHTETHPGESPATPDLAPGPKRAPARWRWRSVHPHRHVATDLRIPRAPLVLMALAAVGLSAVSWGRLILLRHPAPDYAHFPTALRLGFTAYLVVLVAGTLLAHRAIVRSVARHTPSAGAAALLPWALLLCLLSAAMLPLLSNDLFSVFAYVDLQWNAHISPYTLPRPGLKASRYYPLVSTVWNWAPCVYGPVQLVYWAPVLLGGVTAALGIAKALALAAALATIGLVYAYCRRMPTGGAAAFALVALNPVLWVEGAGQAHCDLLTAAFLALWLVCGAAVPALAAIALGLAVASKMTALVPAGMYFVFLLARPGRRPLARVVGALLAGVLFAATLFGCYRPFWTSAWTLRMPLAFLASRWPTNSIFELLFHGAQWAGFPYKLLAGPLSAASGALTGVLALLGIVAAWRAQTFPELVSAAAKVFLLTMTLTSAVFHPWYLLPCLVLAVELRGRAWRRWFLFVSSAVLFLDASCLLPMESLSHGLYRAASLGLVLVITFGRIGPRLAGMVALLRRPVSAA
jgi:hypothetical protein